MSMFKNVLFPTDFSVHSEYGKDYAMAFAQQSNGTVHVTHVVDTSHLPYVAVGGAFASGDVLEHTIDSMREHAQSRLDQFVDVAEFKHVHAEAHLRVGKPAEEIVKLATESKADLIVIGTHGRSGFDRWVFGSTCDKVVRLSPIPVLAIKHPEHEFVKPEGPVVLKRIMVPCDFSHFSHEIVPFAAKMAREFGATLVLTHVVDSRLDYPEFMPGMDQRNTPYLHASAAEMLEKLANEYDDLTTEVEVFTGIPDKELTEAVKNLQIDLVVMATHGHTGVTHALLGSTAEKVVRRAPCPVMTVRPADSEASKKSESKSEAASTR